MDGGISTNQYVAILRISNLTYNKAWIQLDLQAHNAACDQGAVVELCSMSSNTRGQAVTQHCRVLLTLLVWPRSHGASKQSGAVVDI